MRTHHPRRLLRRLWAEESGAQSLEFVAILPMVLLVLLLMLQVAALAYTLVVAEAVARDAAVAAANDPHIYTEWKTGHTQGVTRLDQVATDSAASIPVKIESLDCDYGKITLQLRAKVPNLLFEVPFDFTRKVVMPTLQGGCP